MDKKVIINRAIFYSRRVTRYKEIIQKLNALEVELVTFKVPSNSITSTKKYIQRNHDILTKHIGHLIEKLINSSLEPFYQSKKFGELITLEDITIANNKATYQTINYISSMELKKGYIILDLITHDQNSIHATEKEFILNLHTGEVYPRSSGNIPENPVI